SSTENGTLELNSQRQEPPQTDNDSSKEAHKSNYGIQKKSKI
ncbi:30885_t:CDS:1, partial [Gigaspora margarita]